MFLALVAGDGEGSVLESIREVGAHLSNYNTLQAAGLLVDDSAGGHGDAPLKPGDDLVVSGELSVDSIWAGGAFRLELAPTL